MKLLFRNDEPTKQLGPGGPSRLVEHLVPTNAQGVADANGTGRQEQRGTEPMGAEHATSERGRKNVSYSDDGADNESWSQRDQWALENSYGKSNGRPRNWSPEPGVGRVAHGIPNRSHRLKGLGNAIVPQVAFVFLDAIRRVEVMAAQAGVAGLQGLSVPHERTTRESQRRSGA